MKRRKRHGKSKANRGTLSKGSRVFGYGDDNNRWARVSVDAWVVVGAKVEQRDGSARGRIEHVGWQREWHGWSNLHPAVFVRYDKNDGNPSGWSSLPLTLREFYLWFKPSPA